LVANGRVQHRKPARVPEWLVAPVRVGSDAAIAALGFTLAYWLRYGLELGGAIASYSHQPLSYFYGKILLFVIALVLVFQVKGLYRMPRWSSLLDESWMVASGTVIAMSIVILYAFFQRFAPSRLVFIIAIPTIIALLILKRIIVRVVRERLWSRGIGVDRVVVVGSGKAGQRLLQWLLSQPQLGYEVVGFVDDSPEPPQLTIATPNGVVRPLYLGRSAELPGIVDERQVDEVIIALPPTEHERMLSIVDECRSRDVEFKLVPDLFEMALDKVNIHEVAGMPLIGLKPVKLSGWNFAVKRMMDVAIALFVLIAFSWIFLLTSLAIKLDSNGPIFFRQERVGRNGRRFICYKFRTMIQDAEAQKAKLQEMYQREDLLFKLKDDPRCTRVGRFLRRASLDELPQFFNVFVGDMSVVGPRPGVPVEVAAYEEWHFDRLMVLPGLTGLWQVSGRSNLTFDEMVRLDLYYAEHWSPWLDIKTMLRTVPAILTARGAY
jgi:exopolysaccharide biosynthesis polyprenyl glycosylphosphotransferase